MPAQSFVCHFPVVNKKTGADTQTREVGPIIFMCFRNWTNARF